MNEIVRQDYFGASVEFRRDAGSGDLWITAEQAAPLLGLSSPRAVRKLFSDNGSEFIEGVEWARVTIKVATRSGTNGSGPAQSKSVLVFSLAGLDHLALLTRNEKGSKLRRWVVDLRQGLRSGQVVVADAARVAHLEGVVSRLFSALDRMTGIVDVHASNAGRLLSYLSRNPPPDHPGQVRLFDDGSNPKLTG